MTDDQEVQRRYDKASTPPMRQLKMTQPQSALLFNLLVDNAQSWNAPLREQLTQVVARTETFNARVAVKEGKLPEFLEGGR